MKRLETVNFSYADNNNILIVMLNRALADEWNAVAQYLAPIKWQVTGKLKDEIFSELKEHANEEYEHAVKLKARIAELGYNPLIDPEDWVNWCNPDGKFVKPGDTSESILSVNIKSEQGAIKVYQDIMRFAKTIGDKVTYELAEQIYKDECKHETDLMKLQSQLHEENKDESIRDN